MNIRGVKYGYSLRAIYPSPVDSVPAQLTAAALLLATTIYELRSARLGPGDGIGRPNPLYRELVRPWTMSWTTGG